eukprot:4670060-Amphidinium_carterae.1
MHWDKYWTVHRTWVCLTGHGTPTRRAAYALYNQAAVMWVDKVCEASPLMRRLSLQSWFGSQSLYLAQVLQHPLQPVLFSFCCVSSDSVWQVGASSLFIVVP